MKKIGETGIFKLGCDAKGKEKGFEFGDKIVPQKFFRVDRISAVDEVQGYLAHKNPHPP